MLAFAGSRLTGVDPHSARTTREGYVRRQLILALVTVIALAALLAASTKLVMSWKNPGYTNPKFHRMLVLGMSDKTEIRANFEDALSSKIARPGIETIPGNQILLRPEGSTVNLDYIKTQVRSNHVDAVIVSRLVKVDKNIKYVPGQTYYLPYPYYGTFYGYYGAIYQQVYTPGYLREEKKVRIETNLYSTTGAEGELVWTAISDTFDPSSATKAIDGVVKLVVKELEKEKLI